MSSQDADLLNLTNAAGFLFQIRVEHEITSTSSTHGKSIVAREHRWAHLKTGQQGFTDLIVTAGTNGKLVVECKRVRDAEWVFLLPRDARQTMSARILWTMRFDKDRHGAAWDELLFEPQSLESDFCIVRGHADTQQPMLERVATALLVSVEALADEESSYDRPAGRGGLHFCFPVVVTSATLHACRVEASEIDLLSGELKTGSFEQVPFIRFTKSMSSSRPSSRRVSNLAESARESRRTVFVVNAAHLAQFLSGKWEFRPPPWGGPWPWELPAWQ